MAKQDPEKVVDQIIKSIRQHIKDAGYRSIAEFCSRNRIQRSTMYRTIGKSRTPRLKTLVEIGNALGITLDELIRQ